MKTKTLTAVSIAALAVPGAALAGGTGHGKSSHAKSTHAEKGSKGKAFVVRGVDANVTDHLPVASGKLTGPLTLDPTSANTHARRILDGGALLTKEELRRDDKTVTFGRDGDDVVVKYVGLQSTDPLAETDRVKVVGKITRSGVLNIRKITVVRKTTATGTRS